MRINIQIPIWAAIISTAIAVIITIACSSCQPVTVPTCDTVDRVVHTKDTVVVRLPAKLDSFFNISRRTNANSFYYRIHVDTLNLLFTEVEIYNAKHRANMNKDELTTDRAVKPVSFRFTGGALPSVTGQHTLRSDCLTCHK